MTDLLSCSKEELFNPFHETGTVSFKVIWCVCCFVVVVVVSLFLNHKDLLSGEVEDVKGLSAGGGSNTDERRYKNPFPQRRPPVTVDPSRPPYLLPPPTTRYTCLGKLYKSHTCRERRFIASGERRLAALSSLTELLFASHEIFEVAKTESY